MSNAATCPTNLGPRQVQLRLVGGLAGALLALGVGAWCVLAQHPWWPWRVVAVALAFTGALNLLQARAKT